MVGINQDLDCLQLFLAFACDISSQIFMTICWHHTITQPSLTYLPSSISLSFPLNLLLRPFSLSRGPRCARVAAWPIFLEWDWIRKYQMPEKNFIFNNLRSDTHRLQYNSNNIIYFMVPGALMALLAPRQSPPSTVKLHGHQQMPRHRQKKHRNQFVWAFDFRRRSQWLDKAIMS